MHVPLERRTFQSSAPTRKSAAPHVNAPPACAPHRLANIDVSAPIQRLTGAFTEIPAGPIEMKLKGTALQSNFAMEAKFTPSGADAADVEQYGEYRQHLSGAFLADGVAADWPIGGAQLSANLIEDADAEGENYGHRANAHKVGDGYYAGAVANQATGPIYRGVDAPGFDPSDDEAEVQEVTLNFRGRLIDTRDNSVLAQSNWTVHGRDPELDLVGAGDPDIDSDADDAPAPVDNAPAPIADVPAAPIAPA